ncbi:MAG: SpoIIE family protein phosphatase [Isosphaeraceae bacterium]
MSHEVNAIRPTLQRREDGRLGEIRELEERVTLMGRSPECQVRLEDHLISKHHARIVRKGGFFTIEDLGSRNFTYINGVKLRPNQPVPLRDGNVIRICEAEFIYRDRTIKVVNNEGPEGRSTVLGERELTPSGRRTPGPSADEALRSLVDFSRSIGGSLDVGETLTRALDSLFAVFEQAECGFILLRVEDSDELVPRAIRFRGGREQDFTISRTILKNALKEGKATLTLDASEDPDYDGVESVQIQNIRTAMCAPILNREDRAVGVVQLDTRSVRAKFGTRDLDLLAGFAAQIGVAIELCRLHDIESKHIRDRREQRFAREVQMGLLPHDRPKLPGYRFWDFYEPAKVVGGDYYDYIALGDRCGQGWGIALGDVAGKGLPAALLMAKLGSDVRLSVLTEPDPALKVERLNRRLCDTRLRDRFVTLLLTLLNPESHRLTIVNAGHNYPILRKADGTVLEVGNGQGGMMLGVDEEARYRAVEVDLEPGDTVVLFTDGVNEAMNAQQCQLGIPRLLRAIAQAPADVDAIGNHILKTINVFVAGHPQSDDIAILCFGRPPEGAAAGPKS